MKSGDTLSIKTLFNNKITIPDMQRDYCWGDNAWDKNGEKSFELVSSFLNNIHDLYEDFKNGNREPVQLGLIYAYTSQEKLSNLYLCDGQQRITTIFLILGYLNRFTKNSHDSELAINTDGIIEPRLCYSIRESTLYFISDLVENYFLNPENNNYKIDEIQKQNWYFHDYELDPSITSIIAALRIIEKWYEKNNIEADSYFDFILNNLEFIYYDLEDREKGEETYVTINTTGEPLTASENLKPILIGHITTEIERELYSNQWEEREDWFWKNKGTDTTTDSNLNQFFIWYWQIGLLQEKTWKKDEELDLNPRELFTKNGISIQVSETEFLTETRRIDSFKSLDCIHSYFKGLKLFIELIEKDTDLKAVMQIIHNKENYELNFFTKEMSKEDAITIVLPSISYLKKYPNQTNFLNFFRRLRKNYINSKRKIGSIVDWRHIIQIIEFSKSELEVLSYNTLANKEKFKAIPNVDLGIWYDKDEINKDKLKAKNKATIENWEDHQDIKGDLSFIWKALAPDEITFEKASAIWENFITLQDALHEESATDYKISNDFRLFLVLIDSSVIKHIPRCNGINGVLFSRSDKKANYDYFFNDEYQNLIKKKSLKTGLNNFIKKKINEMNLLTFKDWDSLESYSLLKIWLICKTLIADQNKVSLSFYDENGIGIYNETERNCYSDKHSFTLGNFVCGYAVKSGFGGSSYCWYGYEHNWDSIEQLNTPLLPNLFPYPKKHPYDFRSTSLKDVEAAINTTNKKMKKIIKDILEI